MTRWLVVLVTMVAVLVAGAGVRSYQPSTQVFDEILTYEVTPGKPLSIRVPGGIDEVILTSWVVVEENDRYDPRDAHEYALGLTLLSAEGEPVDRQTLELSSRVSHDPKKPLSEGDYTARLAESTDWLTDARTQRVETSAMGAQSGTLRLRLLERGSVGRVLIRLVYLEPLGEIERSIRARSLEPERTRRMTRGRVSLGFSDLPGPIKDRALSYWERRCVAVGREGADYLTRKILVGHRLPSVPDSEHSQSETRIFPERPVAFNFRGPVKLRVEAAPGTGLAVEDGEEAAYRVVVGDSGALELSLPESGARTVAIGADRETPARFTVDAAEAGAQIGVYDRPFEQGRVTLEPDFRVQTYLGLDPARPVTFRAAPGQRTLGLVVRAFVKPGSGSGLASARVALPGDPEVELEPMDEALEASRFDRVGARLITEPRYLTLKIPDGRDRIAVRGSADTMVLGYTDEPGVSSDTLEEAYSVELDEGHVFRHAPSIEQTTAAIRAENEQELVAEERTRRVEVAVRIEALRRTGPALVERVTTPAGTPVTRLCWMPASYTRGANPEGLWSRLPFEQARDLVVAPGAAPELRVAYRVPAAVLGKELSLVVDGRSRKKALLQVRSGRIESRVPPGRHRISLTGVGDGIAFASAVPDGAGPVFRRQSVHRIAPGGSLDLGFERRKSELLALFVTMVQKDGPGRTVLSYRIDPDRRSEAQPRLVRRITEFRGELPIEASSRERALLWEAADSIVGDDLPHAVGKARVELGDDLELGAHVLRLTARPGGGPVWVRAVLAGRVFQDDAARVSGGK